MKKLNLFSIALFAVLMSCNREAKEGSVDKQVLFEYSENITDALSCGGSNLKLYSDNTFELNYVSSVYLEEDKAEFELLIDNFKGTYQKDENKVTVQIIEDEYTLYKGGVVENSGNRTFEDIGKEVIFLNKYISGATNFDDCIDDYFILTK
ncbi:copper resistance protein NlpE [Flammeovirga yaeyamensis]|uniref:Copper resistance protein NlpE n=1 Tax=Flammeovirga yaeyamensis TaxID=367791 RepID=A0AAX1NBN2_9BACT|nr:hypothetical protein [Flammeovirga yaeyamensis]MBB3697167.1 hypothetical protein [Flammeovirga yaeyamensis]NMF33827.1 copper resistance protein NlpE [Flammeovirga yaeyamensis]QWG04909.1 copper resistance protein NlpE [Flammeovirga yaeyamensis]